MSAEWTPRPYVVGEENVYVIGIQGIVEAVTRESLTINGHTFPRVMEKGVRYMSMVWPDESECDLEHCGPECDPQPPESDALDDLAALTLAVREWHLDAHTGAMPFCENAVCRTANDRGADA